MRVVARCVSEQGRPTSAKPGVKSIAQNDVQGGQAARPVDPCSVPQQTERDDLRTQEWTNKKAAPASKAGAACGWCGPDGTNTHAKVAPHRPQIAVSLHLGTV